MYFLLIPHVHLASMSSSKTKVMLHTYYFCESFAMFHLPIFAIGLDNEMIRNWIDVEMFLKETMKQK